MTFFFGQANVLVAVYAGHEIGDLKGVVVF